MGKTEIIKIQDGEQIVELKGAELEAFFAQRKLDQAEASLREADQIAKMQAKEKALKKLADLGLTEEEINAIL